MPITASLFVGAVTTLILIAVTGALTFGWGLLQFG